MDWSEKNSCIKCDDGGNLLVCSENGCPLAVHEGCLGCPAKFDDSGRFYCPYCLYKQAVAESRKAREYALARKKALLIFMDERIIGSEKHTVENKTCEDNGHNQSKTSDANVNITSSDNGRSKPNNNGIDQPFQLDGEEKISNAEEGFEDSEDSAGSKGEEPSLEMHGGKSNRTEEVKQVQEEEHETSAEEEQIQEEEHETSAAEEQIQEEEHETSAAEEQIQEEERETLVEEEQIQEGERETSVEEEQIQEGEHETSSASTDQDPSLTVHVRAKRGGSKRSEPVDKDSDADPVRSKRLKQHGKKKQTSPTVTPTRRSVRKSSSAMRTGKVLNEEIGSPRRLRKPEEPSGKLASDTFGSAKRKRLLWTEKEEEALRAGVERYSKDSKNLPWRKILDLGSHKFDATRTPADLKDKWRNMSAK